MIELDKNNLKNYVTAIVSSENKYRIPERPFQVKLIHKKSAGYQVELKFTVPKPCDKDIYRSVSSIYKMYTQLNEVNLLLTILEIS